MWPLNIARVLRKPGCAVDLQNARLLQRLNTGMRGPDGLHVQVEDPNAGGGMMKAGIAAGTSAFPSRPAHS